MTRSPKLAYLSLSLTIILSAIIGWSTRVKDRTVDANLVFQQHCASCHGDVGDGKGPGYLDAPVKSTNLTDPTAYIYGSDLDSVVDSIAHGRTSAMPPFDDRLSKEQVTELAKFVVGLQREKQPRSVR